MKKVFILFTIVLSCALYSNATANVPLKADMATEANVPLEADMATEAFIPEGGDCTCTVLFLEWCRIQTTTSIIDLELCIINPSFDIYIYNYSCTREYTFRYL
jgi:hypothetical protein